MKQVIFAIALLAPGLAAAYPDPNVNAAISAGDLVESIWTQPDAPEPVVLAANLIAPDVK